MHLLDITASTTTRRRLLSIAAATTLGAVPVLALAAPASAAGGVFEVGNTLVVNAANNKANNITVTRSGTFFFVRDTGDTLAVGLRCVRINPNLARCAAPGIARIAVNAGDRNDRVTNATVNPSTQNGGTGDDTLTGGSGNDTLNGGAGNDRAVARALRDGRDVFTGGTGVDTADYSARIIAVNVSLDGLANDGSAPEFDNNRADVERATGGAASDTLTGNAQNNVLDGRNGNDTLRGLGGNDTLLGGAGNDRALAQALRDGRDTFNGGAGVDTTDYSARVIGVTVTLNSVANDGSAPEFDNNLANVENAVGGRVGDTLTGNASANNLQGRNGNDTLNGLTGNDTLIGGAGRDRLNGGAGNDRLLSVDGVRGNDRNDGGANADTCASDLLDIRISC